MIDSGGDDQVLVCEDLHVAYDKVQVLFGVDLVVGRGEIVALLGTNGAGKSTLLKAVSGLVEPARGRIIFDGNDITNAGAVATAKMGIVLVPGGRAVFPSLTVAEHFKAASWMLAKEPTGEVADRTNEVLELFPQLQSRWDQMAGNLSGGEQQQLGLGMAFVAKPRLLVIDELSLGLSPTVVEQLLGIVRRIHAGGCSVILVEQSVNVALTLAERAYFMEKGEVRFEGATAGLLERDDILRSVFLQGAVPVTPTEDRPVRVAASEPRPADPDERPEEKRTSVLSVQGLYKSFGGVQAVRDVSFDVGDGQIVGLIGPNGAGKTTVLDLISGVVAADRGRVVLRGLDVSKWGADRRAAVGLGRSFQDARIFPSLTVAENLAIGLERHVEVRDHLAAALDLPAVQDSERDVGRRVEELVERMSLQSFRDKFVSELSTGSRRIVDLAMALAHDPAVLILDEPSSGIAQRETEALGPLLLRIKEETGAAMIVIEHDMPLITSISDQLVALEVGSVVTIGPPEQVISDPRVVESYLGGDMRVIQRSGAASSAQEPESSS